MSSENKKRLIDADELLNHLYNKQQERVDVALEIARFPTVDAVPVVRCKDCKYTDKCGRGLICTHWMRGGIVTGDDYCSNGERRNGDAER